jgi:hypothetical protein
MRIAENRFATELRHEFLRQRFTREVHRFTSYYLILDNLSRGG